MTSINRKVLIVAAAAIIFISMCLHFILSAPRSQPDATPYETSRKEPSPARPPQPPVRSESPVDFGIALKSEHMSQKDQDVISKIELQGISHQNARQLKRMDIVIREGVADYLIDVSNWMPELRKAASTIILGKNGDPSMLKIYDINEDSILNELGLKNGDILALIDDEIPVFGIEQAPKYTKMMLQFISALGKGDPVSVTVLRNGTPIRLVYHR